MNFGLEQLGGVHLQRIEPDSFDRPRGIKTAAQALERWKAGTSAGEQTWATNLQATTKPIVDAAIAQQGVAISNYTRALSSGLWAAKLRAVGDAGIKQAAAKKSANYGTGVAAAADKFGVFLTKLIAYQSANLPSIYQMPSGTPGAGKARMNAWFDIMAASKGSFV